MVRVVSGLAFWLFASAAAVCWLTPGAEGRWFDPHHEYHYTYSARTQTWLDHEIITVIKLRVHYMNETAASKHLMKLFVDSFWQRDDQGHAAANPKKWNLAKPFFFTMTANGLVEFVHIHPEEHDELKVLKKAVVSVFSAHVEDLEPHEYEAEYSREEPDHQGVNKMRYRVEKVGGKKVVTRQHSSSGDADRYHDKVLHFNEDNDLHQVFSNDFILMKDTTPHISDTREPFPDEKIIEEEEMGEFPEIHVTANTTVTLKHKIPKRIPAVDPASARIMQKDSIVVNYDHKYHDHWEEAVAVIDEQLKCLAKLNKSQATGNRSECMHRIHHALQDLTDDALYAVAGNYLNVSCGRAKVDQQCLDARLTMINALGSMDSPLTQRLLLWFVLKRPRSAQETEEVFTHLITMSQPIPQLIAYLEADCFGEKFEKHGGSVLEERQRRTCLILGAVAKNLNNTDPMRAAQLMGHIEGWIDKHGQKHGRHRRDITIDPDEDEGYYMVFDEKEMDQNTRKEQVEMTRVVLLEVLGNAGLKKSLDYLLEHARPNTGMSSWRRAAIHAMRTFQCDESATSLLTAALHDGHEEVRAEALDIYKSHPKAFELSPEQEAVVLARNVSTETIHSGRRDKRGLEEILCALSFFIEVPGVNWKKEVGSKAMGASIGIILRNYMSLNMAPLSGQFKIEVHDEAWAEVHIGFIKLYFDILRIRLCFKGHIRYDLNVLKNFGIDSPTDLVTKFDKIIASVADPIIQAVDDMLWVITTLGERGLIGMVSDLIKSTLEMDSGVRNMVATTRNFQSLASGYTGKPWIRSVQLYARKMDGILLEVSNSYADFYNAIGNDLMVTLPSSLTDIFDALKAIATAVVNIVESPLGVINSITNAITVIRMSIMQAVRAKMRIENFFRSGKMPYCIEADDLAESGKDTEAAIRLVEDIIAATNSVVQGPVGVGPGVGGRNLLLSERAVALALRDELSNMKRLQENFVETTKYFLDSYNAVMETIKRVKRIHFNLKKFKAKADTIIKLLSGVKNEPAFPQTVLQNCAMDCGNYPINDDGLPDGIRIDAPVKRNIPAPANGIAYRSHRDGKEFITLDCTDDALKEWSLEIFNMNISLVITPAGKVVCANESLGTAGKSSCNPNSIHLVLRKKDTGETHDPRGWLRAPAPLPKWKQVCNDFKFVLLGITLDAATIADGKDAVKHARERTAKSLVAFTNAKIPEPEPYRPAKASEAMNYIMAKRLTPLMKKITDLKTLLKDNKISTAGDHPEASVDKFPVSVMMEVLELGGKSSSMTKLEGIVEELIQLTMTEGPLTFSDTTKAFYVRETLKPFGLDVSQSEVAAMLETFESGCPNIVKNLHPFSHHYAVVRPDCKRVRVGVQLTYMELLTRKLLELVLELKSCDINDGLKLILGAETPQEYDIPAQDGVQVLDISFVNLADDMGAKLIVSYSMSDSSEILISIHAELCSTVSGLCFEPIIVTNSMVFGVASDCATATVDTSGIRDRIMGLKMKELINEVNTAAMPLDDVLESMAEIRVAIYDVIRLVATIPCGREPGEKEKMMAGGLDFCIKGGYKTKPKDFIFFKFQNVFMAGPVPLKLEFGAGGSCGVDLTGKLCFLTMKATATITPWFAAKVWGSASIFLGFAEGGIKLTGFVMETRLPGTATVYFSKFPLDFNGKLDFILVPLKLILSAYASLNLIIKMVKIFEANIWEYAMPAITGTLFKFGSKAEDFQGPSFSTVDVNVPDKQLAKKVKAVKKLAGVAPAPAKRKKRETEKAYQEGCSVEQLRGRHPKQPAYLVTAFSFDSESTPYTEFCVGMSAYNCDQKEWTEMKSNPTYVEEPLRDGVPLYWTVRLTDDFGLQTSAICTLDTYDMTVPQGYVKWYPVSANRHNIRGNLEAFEDSYFNLHHEIGLGYAAGNTGDQVVPWAMFNYNDETDENGGQAGTSLKSFGDPQDGRLASEPVEIHEDIPDPYACADMCNAISCLSFDWDVFSAECLLHQKVQVSDILVLRPSRKFQYWQRLGVFDSWWFEFNALPGMVHGQLLIMNAHMTNILGYEGYLSSHGTLLDFEPPFPDPLVVGEILSDEFVAEGCQASIMQRCHEVTEFENHRRVVAHDVVFPGNVRFKATKYTSSNHYLSGNWHEYLDLESGIWGYAWKAGSEVCGNDVFDWVDPFAHLLDPAMWTYQGLIRDVLMPDGHYYLTVEAVNKVIYGGSLVTTICHPVSIVIDTSAPVLGEPFIRDVIYDDAFKALVIYFNLTDPESGLLELSVGLGRTKHDVEILKYQAITNARLLQDMLVGLWDIELQDGVPAWPRLRGENNVGLITTGSANSPIMVDRTPPVAGSVFDGDLSPPADVVWWASNDSICAQWIDFFDPDTGIDSYYWSVGTAPGLNDTVMKTEYSHRVYKACADVTLEHMVTYYSTVLAFNRGLNKGCVDATSNGVTVDLTPPETGYVYDGLELDEDGEDMKFSSKPATVSAHWTDFQDPESNITAILLSIIVNGEVQEERDLEPGTETFESHTHNHNHNDYIETRVTVTNGARAMTQNISDGFRIDLTPPRLQYLRDSETGGNYQTNKDSLLASWSVDDPETDVKEVRYTLYKRYGGQKERIWPLTNNPSYLVIVPTEEGENGTRPGSFEYTGADITDGPLYFVELIAVNYAGLSLLHESEGVQIDSTAPFMDYVLIGELEQNIDPDENVILAADPENLQGRWKARDAESGIMVYYVAVGTTPGGTEITGDFIDMGIQTSGTISNLDMPVTEESKNMYYLSVKCTNGAGLESDVVSSLPIKMLRANQPGVVFDGRDLTVDWYAQFDSTSVAVSFSGFESELCGIVGYKWGISNVPGNSDLLAFTSSGIGPVSDTHRIAATNLDLPENKQVFVDVVAITGHGCHEEMIVSSSNGIWVDVKKPAIAVTMLGEQNVEIGALPTDRNFYQVTDDTLPVKYAVTDAESGYQYSTWAVGSCPRGSDLHAPQNLTLPTQIPLGEITLEDADTLWLTIYGCDYVPNCETYISSAVTIDPSPPIILGFSCHQYLSHRRRVLRCEWEYNKDDESGVTHSLITIGRQPQDGSIHSEELKSFILAWHLSVPEDDLNIGAPYIITLTSYNRVGLESYVFDTMYYDMTDPEPGEVHIITSSVPGHVADEHVECQESMTHVTVAWTPFGEDHSVIDSYHVAIGVGDDPISVTDFRKVPEDEEELSRFTIDAIAMASGTRFYATVRAFNLAGLYTTVQSSEVVVSPLPYITVLDGYTGVDTRYTMSEAMYEAKWFPSDSCPLVNVSWTLVSLDETQEIQPRTQVAVDEDRLYADQVVLEKDRTYCAMLYAEDIIGRDIVGRSNCVTVYLEKPNPAEVWIGTTMEGNSFKYQESVAELSCTWAEFGMPDVDEPGQIIDYYEVAIGSDPTTESGQSNIHFYVNVGTERTHTFRDLGLVAKTVAYYCTVRAMSKAQSYTTISSTQIYVGFRDEMNPAPIYIPVCQPTNTTIEAAWDRFDSDFPIIRYFVNVFAHSFEVSDNRSCEENVAAAGEALLEEWIDVGKEEMFIFEELALVSGLQYWVAVYGYDDAVHCSMNISDPVMVDVDAPVPGSIHVGKEVNDVIHIATVDKISAVFENWTDSQSGIVSYQVALVKMPDCLTSDFSEMEIIKDYVELLTADTDLTEVHFEGLTIEPRTPYYVVIVATNCAGLTTQVWSPPIFLDETAPLEGDIKDGPLFERDEIYTINTTDLFATFTMVHSPDDVFCETIRVDSFQDAVPDNWKVLDKKQLKDKKEKRLAYQKFLKEMTENSPKGQKIFMKQHLGEKNMQGPAIQSELDDLLEGTYSISLQAVPGESVLTRFELLWNESPEGYLVPPTPDNVVEEDDFDEEANPDVEAFGEDEATEATVTADPGNTTYVPFVFTDPNVTFVNIGEVGYGFGMVILGEEQLSSDGSGKAFYVLFWIITDGLISSRWLEMQFDPTEALHNYTITIKPQVSGFVTLYDVSFAIDDAHMEKISQQDLGGRQYYALISVMTNNERFPTPVDPFTPLEAEGLVDHVIFPLPRDQLCHFGEPFYDFESGIVEIWAGIGTNSTELEADILPMHKYQDVCLRCNHPCDDFSCDLNCTDDDIRDLVQIHFSGLDLSPGVVGVEGELAGKWIPAKYYILAKLVNQAGLYSFVKTDGIIIDQTPPEFNVTDCMDPWFSMSTPSIEQASNVSMGAAWLAFDDESAILEYNVAPAVKNSTDGELEFIANFTRLFHTATEHIIKKLSLEQDEEYYYVVVAENGAHLTTTASCSIRVNMLPPVVDVPPAEPLNTVEDASFPPSVAVTRADDYIGVAWPPEDLVDCWTVDWQASSNDEKGSGNVFPRTIVGPGGAVSSVEVSDGNLIATIGGIKKIMGIGDFSKVNWTTLTPEEFDEVRARNAFKYEMGKCIIHEMFCVGKNNLDTDLKPVTVCQRREEDVTAALPAGQSATLGSQNAARRKRQLDGGITFIIPPSAETSGLSYGTLDEEDTLQDFDSAPVPDYHPYVVNPNETRHMTSRLMWNRVQEHVGTHFYLSPAGDLWLEDPIKASIPADVRLGEAEELNVIYWDVGVQQWKHSAESCDQYPVVDNLVMEAVICQTMTYKKPEDLNPPTPDSYPVTATMYTVVIQLDTPQNDPPELESDYLTMLEDEELTVQLRHYDTADDKVKWYLHSPPSQGHASISEEGVLYYRPVRDRYGQDMLDVRMVEYDLPSVMTPLETIANLTINIEPTDDEPYLLVLYNHNEHIVYRRNDTDIIVEESITIENREMELFGSKTVALIVLFDPDEGSSMDVLFQVYNTDTEQYEDVAEDQFVLRNFSLSQSFVNSIVVQMVYPQLTWFDPTSSRAWLVDSQFSSGVHQFRLLGRDDSGRQSTQFKITAGIMQNPCDHGYCVGPEDDPNCTDWRRTESFDGYSCECYDGYSGDTCDEGCHCSSFHECIIRSECNSWGVCQEVSYDCSLMTKMVVMAAGGGGAGLVCLLLVGIVVCCCKFMPKLERSKEDYSNSDPQELPPLTQMFNFFGYAKQDPVYQGHQGQENHGYVSDSVDKPGHRSSGRPYSGQQEEYSRPWYLDALSPSRLRGNLWRDQPSSDGRDGYDRQVDDDYNQPPPPVTYQGFANQAYEHDPRNVPAVENIGRSVERLPRTAGPEYEATPANRLPRSTENARGLPRSYEADVQRLPRSYEEQDAGPRLPRSSDNVARLPRS